MTESLENRLSCVPRTEACEETRRPTSSKNRKQKRHCSGTKPGNTSMSERQVEIKMNATYNINIFM